MNLERLKSQLKRHEGVRLKPYWDSVGKLTVGVGRNLSDVGITEEEADYLLENDIFRAAILVKKLLPDLDQLDDLRQEVLINMAFNLGNRIRSFKNMWAAIKVRDYERAAAAMLDSKWAEQVGARARELAEQMKRGDDENMKREMKQPDLRDPRGEFRGGSYGVLGEMPVPEYDFRVKIPWYRQDGLKRGIGVMLTIAGIIVKTFHPAGAGEALIQAGALVGGIGIVHAGIKSKKQYKNESGLLDQIIEVIKRILNLLSKKGGES